jgi:prepilin-type N-terminal cleavage/methylation domain-containing protein
LKSSIKSKGFSLIEMLIALVILSISLLALAGLMVTTTKNNSFGSHMTEAATFAQDKLEELRVTRWTNIVSGNDTVQGSTGIQYNRSWNVSTLPNPNPPPNDLQKTANILIRWYDGINRSITILSVISN